MITRKDVMPVNFLKKEKFTGSYKGMRYLVKKEKDDAENDIFRATVWPGPYNFSTTPDDIVAGTIWIRRNAGRGEDPRGISIFGRRNCERGRVAERAACAVCEARKIDGCVNRKSEKVE